MAEGLLIALEGIDGAGKSAVRVALQERHPDWATTAEPSSMVGYGNDARQLLQGKLDLPREALVHLMLLGRYQHLKCWVGPQLRRHPVVIVDRYTCSTLVYQQEFYELSTLLDLCKHSRRADLTILLDVTPDVALKRVKGRQAEEPYAAQLAEMAGRYNRLWNSWDPDGPIGLVERVNANWPLELVVEAVEIQIVRAQIIAQARSRSDNPAQLNSDRPVVDPQDA